jgi:membrane protease YdiL (CAAX protease family)
VLPAATISIALPVALVTSAVLVVPLRWPVLVLLVLGVAWLHRRRSDLAWLWAALVPLAVRLAYEIVIAAPRPSLADCGNVLAPAAVSRAIEASVVVGSVAVLAITLGAGGRSLALRWPSRLVVACAALGLLVGAPLAVLIGPLLTSPFFGEVRIETGLPSAMVPALVLAGSNSIMEELAFRGAMLGWGSRAIGPRPALVLQAALFGLAHVGSDFLNPFVAVPVLAAVMAGGLIAGSVVQRSGSLLLPIAIHAALDVPLYYAFGCRLS